MCSLAGPDRVRDGEPCWNRNRRSRIRNRPDDLGSARRHVLARSCDMRHQPFIPTCRELRPLAEYCDRLPSRRRGRKLNRATLYRWALHGVSGGRILQTVELGGGRFTCDAWVAEFMRQLSEPSPGKGLSEAKRSKIAKHLGSPNGKDIA